MQKSTTQDAVVDFVKALRPVFKKYTRHTRTKAWEDLTSKKGDQQMKKILVDPDRPALLKQLAFKEWLLQENVIKVDTKKIHNRMGQPKFINYKVYRNPTKAELLEAIETDKKMNAMSGYESHNSARGLIDGKGNLYIWPLNAAMHYDIEVKFNINSLANFYIDEDNIEGAVGYSESEERIIKNNPNYKKMMGITTTTSVPVPSLPTTPTLKWQDTLKPKKAVPGGNIPLSYEWAEK